MPTTSQRMTIASLQQSAPSTASCSQSTPYILYQPPSWARPAASRRAFASRELSCSALVTLKCETFYDHGLFNHGNNSSTLQEDERRCGLLRVRRAIASRGMSAATHNQPWEPVEHLIQHNRRLVRWSRSFTAKATADDEPWKHARLSPVHLLATTSRRSNRRMGPNSTLIGPAVGPATAAEAEDHRARSSANSCTACRSSLNEYDFNRWLRLFIGSASRVRALLSLFGGDWNVDCMNRVLPGSRAKASCCEKRDYNGTTMSLATRNWRRSICLRQFGE